MIHESKNVQTTLTCTYCKCSRPLPYCNPNCRTPPHWKFTPHQRTTQPPPTVCSDIFVLIITDFTVIYMSALCGLTLQQFTYLSLFMWSLTINSAVLVVSPKAVVLQNIQHTGHLTEYEYSRSCRKPMDP